MEKSKREMKSGGKTTPHCTPQHINLFSNGDNYLKKEYVMCSKLWHWQSIKVLKESLLFDLFAWITFNSPQPPQPSTHWTVRNVRVSTNSSFRYRSPKYQIVSISPHHIPFTRRTQLSLHTSQSHLRNVCLRKTSSRFPSTSELANFQILLNSYTRDRWTYSLTN